LQVCATSSAAARPGCQRPSRCGIGTLRHWVGHTFDALQEPGSGGSGAFRRAAVAWCFMREWCRVAGRAASL